MIFDNDKILITGGNGFLGHHLVKKLVKNGYSNIISVGRNTCDLRDMHQCSNLFAGETPKVVIHLAASVGGIGANMENPAKFMYDNLTMGCNVIHQSYLSKVKNLVFIGTTCSYGKFCPVPFKEDSILTEFPEETNAPYGIAKSTLGLMLKSYNDQYKFGSCYLIPTNMLGEHDNFDPGTSHVVPALIKKILHAKQYNVTVDCWGDGTATRDFLYAGDCADAIILGMNLVTKPDPINIGTGIEVSIKQLVDLLCDLLDFDKSKVTWNKDNPNGQPRRALDCSRANNILGWQAKTSISDALMKTIDWYRDKYGRA